MLLLNFFNAFFSKTQKRYCPGVKPMALSEESFMSIVRDPKTKELCEAFQRGDATAKTKLPAFCWTGRCKEGKTRAAANMEPTQLYMVDIDHVAEPEQMWQAIRQELINAMEQGKDYRIRLVHITPSGKGLRIVAEATQDFETLKEHMEWLCTELRLNECGDLDMCVKDLSRLSFAVPEDYILWKSPNLFNEPAKSPIKRADSGVAIPSPQDGKAEEASGDDREAHREEYEGYKSYCYKGTLLTDIIRKYLEVYGEPEQGEKHNFYNQMVKNFRCIADNNPRVLHALLPRFGGDNDFEYNKTLSQCQSICRTNTLSKLPKDFYFFLVKNGFITRRGEGTTTREATVEEVFNAPERPKVEMPKLPTIFNEFARIAPEDFKLPVIYSIMPVLGTLTTNYYTEYWDGEEQTTTFMNIIFAPPASGKSFSDRVYNRLTETMRLRDSLNHARMLLYDKFNQTKGANDKGKTEPATVLRISQAITSMVQLLTEQKKSQGRHQLVYVHELDTWAKGSRSGGGDKSDLFRVMWENGEYGQNFKSSNTFRGSVRLFLNALITSTPGQIHSYFKDVENGLVTRFSFCEVRNQRFALPQIWKKLTQQEQARIRKVIDRLDSELYYEAYEEYTGDIPIDRLTEEEFDKEVKWQTQFKPKQFVSTEEFHPTIINWLKKQLQLSSKELDDARDTWRRRTGTKMCRLALMCKVLYDKPTAKDIEIIKKFIVWWGDQEMEQSLDLWGAAFNEKQKAQNVKKMPQQPLFDRLADTFTKEDVLREANNLNVKTAWKQIKCLWLKHKVVTMAQDENKTEVFTKLTAPIPRPLSPKGARGVE